MACAAPQIESQNTVSAPATRPPRFTMEGVGARVIRGPDWKWGKQVWYENLKLKSNEFVQKKMYYLVRYCDDRTLKDDANVNI